MMGTFISISRRCTRPQILFTGPHLLYSFSIVPRKPSISVQISTKESQGCINFYQVFLLDYSIEKSFTSPFLHRRSLKMCATRSCIGRCLLLPIVLRYLSHDIPKGRNKHGKLKFYVVSAPIIVKLHLCKKALRWPAEALIHAPNSITAVQFS